MKRATVTIPDELEAELERYLETQTTPPSFTTLVQVALKEFLQNRALRTRGYRPPRGPFHIDPLEEKDEQGEPDVSVDHDRYFGQP